MRDVVIPFEKDARRDHHNCPEMELVEELPEVDVILVNGESVDFTHIVCNGDCISVYPVFESLDIIPVLRRRPERTGHARR